MDDKSKLIVFAKKEVFLIVGFFVVSTFISFTFGFRLGKDYSFLSGPLTEQDRQMVEETAQMKAVEEENVEKQRLQDEQGEIPTDQVSSANEKAEQITKDTNQMMVKRLQEELNDEASPHEQTDDEEADVGKSDIEKADKDGFAGKYTIQVGSFRSLLEAEEFAKGFQVRGYNPIIEKADLDEKGVRFRVSLGAFDNVSEARDYISKEKTLFLSQDYHIRPIK